MSDRVAEIMHLVRTVCEEENLQVTLSGSLRNSLMAGAGAFAGCLLAGPWGGVPGAAVGAGVAAATGSYFKPLCQVIAEWPDEAKKLLAANIETIMGQVEAKDVVTLTAVAAGAAPALRQQIVAAVISFCKNDMNLEITGR